MHHFDRRPFPASALDLSAITSIAGADRNHSASPQLLPCSPSRVLPVEKPLFSPFRSHESIKEDQMKVLTTIAERRLGRVQRSPFVAETMPDPFQRSCSSFDGRRDVASKNSNSVAQSIYLFIDDSLGKIFPPLPDRDSVSTDHCVDKRRSVARLPYRAHTRVLFEKEMDKAEQRSNAFSEVRGSSSSLPKSPFGEASPNRPPAHVFHPPVGLEVVLERIERREIFRGPWVDPAVELSARDDPPLSRETREDFATSNIRSLLHTKKRISRRLKPIASQEGILDTSARILHQNTMSIRQKMSLSHATTNATEMPQVVIVDEPRPQATGSSIFAVPRNNSTLGRPSKQASVTFGDMLQRD